MKIIKYPLQSEYKNLLTRPTQDISVIEERVAPILKRVKEEGDAAIRDFALKFDNLFLDALEVNPDDLKNAGSLLSEDLDRKSTRLNSSHRNTSRMPSSA